MLQTVKMLRVEVIWGLKARIEEHVGRGRARTVLGNCEMGLEGIHRFVEGGALPCSCKRLGHVGVMSV